MIMGLTKVRLRIIITLLKTLGEFFKRKKKPQPMRLEGLKVVEIIERIYAVRNKHLEK